MNDNSVGSNILDTSLQEIELNNEWRTQNDFPKVELNWFQLTKFDECIFFLSMFHICKIHFPTAQLIAFLAFFVATNELSFATDHLFVDSPA